MGITIGIITRNEEKNIRDCILSAKGIADEIVIVDDHSQDGTERIARELGAVVYRKELDNFSAQKNYLLDKTHNEWVLMLDADERLEESLKMRVKDAVKDPECGGFKLLRKNFIFGKYLRYGGNGNDWVLRLFKRKDVKFINEVHEIAVISGNRTEKIYGGAMLHYSTPDLSSYVKKLNRYTDLESGMIKNRRFLFAKLLAHPPADFMKRYIFQFGFLDGTEGFIYAVLCSVYKFIKYTKAIYRP